MGSILLVFLLALPGTGASQDRESRIDLSSVSISSRAGGRAELELQLIDGGDHVISFRNGEVRLDGRAVGRYEPGGTLETNWRELLSHLAASEPREVASLLLEWKPEGLAGGEREAALRLEREFGVLLGVAAVETPATRSETVTVTGPGGTQLSIAPGFLSFETLTEKLSGLQSSLEELGKAAAEATDHLALIVHDDYAIPAGRTISGNLALVGGSLQLGGTVEGDVLVLDGTLVLEPAARVTGNVLQVGGEVAEEGGHIAGELLSLRAAEAEAAPPATVRPRVRVRSVAPRRVVRIGHRNRGFVGSATHNFGHAMSGLMGTIGIFLVLGLIGLATVYFARPQLEVVADAARYSFGRSFAVGLAGQVLFFPVLLILGILVITWLVIPFFLLAVALALVGGYLASAHAVGEAFAARRYQYEWLERLRRSNAYYYVISGLVLLILPFAVESSMWLLGGPGGFLRHLAVIVGCTATWVACTTGFGAVLITRAGTRNLGTPGWRPDDDTWPESGGTEEASTVG